MKKLLRIPSTILATIAAAATLTLTPALAEDQPPGYVDFGKLAAPSGGGQFVEVNIKGHLINLAARLTEKQEPEVAGLLRNLKAIRVNVVGLDDANRAELGDRVTAVRGELERKGWERIVTVIEKGQDVGVYLKHRGEEAIEGIVVTVIENGKQAVLVNVVGDIKPEQLAQIADHFDIEPLRKVAGKVKKS